MNIIEWLKVILLGIVEGITEWLPISSTGHMILVDEFIKLNVTADFKNVFEVVIQLGAILAAVGCGEYESVEAAADKLVKIVDTVEPEAELVEKYEKRYQEFRQIYPALKPVFPHIQ